MPDPLHGDMPVNAERLVVARTKKGWSQGELAARAKVSQQTIAKLEIGTAKSSKFIARIAAALEIPITELDPDFGQSVAESPAVDGPLHYRPPPTLVSQDRTLPVFASAEGTEGNGSLIITSEPIEYVPRPYTLENVREAYGIAIEGESMVPAFEPGDIAWVNPLLNARRGHDVIIFGREDDGATERAMIKRMVSFTEQEWTVEQWRPEKRFKLPRSTWRICHRVVGKLSKR